MKFPITHLLLLLGLLTAFIFINWPFLTPLILAGVFALGLQDLVERLSKKTGLKRIYWIAITLLCGLGLFWIPLSFAIYRIIVYINQPKDIAADRILSQIYVLKDQALQGLQRISDWTGMDLASPARSILESILQKTGSLALEYSTHYLGQLPSIILMSFVFVISLMLMLAQADRAKAFFIKYSPLDQKITEACIQICKKSCSLTLSSIFVVGLIQASLIGLGSLIFGEGDFWLVLTVTFFLSFIPVIGAAPMGYLLAILAFIGGRTGSGIGLAIIATLAGSIDNILKPFLVSGEQKISPVIGFTCVVGAIIMLGLSGLLIGPVIMNLTLGLAPILWPTPQNEGTSINKEGAL